jgi:membrane fusion protein, multidrug efflux system
MSARAGRRGVLMAWTAVGLLTLGGALAGLYLKRSAGGGEAAAKAGVEASGPAARSGKVALASTKSPSTGGGSASTDEPKGSAVPVSVARIATGPVSSYVTSTANLVPENEVKILAEAEGRVAELHVEEGSRVGRGQVIASLAREDAEIALREAQIKAANAKRILDRAGTLLKDNLVSHEAYDKAALDRDVADQELAQAQWRLEKTFIRAPFAGRVTDRNVKLGQHVRPGDILFTVSDFDTLVARIYLPERDVLGLKEGREVRITLKANEQTRFRGTIRRISPVVDTGTGTVKVTVQALAPPAEVRPGAFVTVDVVREVHPQALLLPREAILRELQDSYVFVVRGALAEKRPVSLGLEEGGHIEALSGVVAGEQVIVAGQGGLKPGAAIKIVTTHEASDLGAGLGGPVRG